MLLFDGWTVVQPQIKRKGDNELLLPNVKQGDKLKLNELDPKQHFTKPIARFK